LGDDEVMTILEAIHSQWFQSTWHKFRIVI
jgi:hypothetical protein